MEWSSKYLLSKYPCMQYPWKKRFKKEESFPSTSSTYEHTIYRTDLTHLCVYSIDPKGSKDADDAFSLEFDAEQTWLHVYICDPSAYIRDIKSPVLVCAAKNGSSYYPLGHRTRRMFDADLRQKSSLKVEGIRAVTAVSFRFSSPDETKIDSILVRPCLIRCSIQNTHSYEDASVQFRDKHPFLMRLHTLTRVLQEQLSSTSFSLLPNPVVFGEMKYLSLSPPRILGSQGRIVLAPDPPHKIEVKRMVALMATAVNGVVANIVKVGATDLDAYLDTKVGLYTHFTSPLRRFTDCMLHIELKRMMTQLNRPKGFRLPDDFAHLSAAKISGSAFDLESLGQMIAHSKAAIKSQQTLYQKATQQRYIQYIYQRLIMDGARRVRVRFKIVKACDRYVRLVIFLMDGHNIHLPHVVCRTKKEPIEIGSERALDMRNCRKPHNAFNDGVLPDLEALF